jgi:hypothetical protein
MMPQGRAVQAVMILVVVLVILGLVISAVRLPL